MLEAKQKLVLVKLAHTAIWTVMVAAICSIIYAGISGYVSKVTYASLGLLVFEGIALLVGKGNCPLTPVARRFSDSPKANMDIYLPEWLAKYNKLIFGLLLAIGLVLLAWRIWVE